MSHPGQPPIPDVPEVDIDDAERLISGGAIALDVREPQEFAQGVIPGAILIPRGDLPERIRGEIPDTSAQIVAYCAGGVRSAYAAETLAGLGYTRVVSMAGGMNEWAEAGKPVATAGQ
ncbi:MAG TPA: rhodanese-like domain-containing protein [Thermomicrobiales bacterium]|jgi:rhodanese-related sulfurtransferase|nr:rhodanese-like domain-containing protein [Thermomicrobiales bacterium]